MLENMASFVSSEHLGAATFDPPIGPTGDGRLLSPNYKPVPTKDGYVTVRPNTNVQAFAFSTRSSGPSSRPIRASTALPRAPGTPRLLRGSGHLPRPQDDRRMGRSVRQARRAAARYNTIDDLMTDPHLKDVGFYRKSSIRPRARSAAASSPMSSPAAPARTRLTRRCYGEHTREILGELGYRPQTSTRWSRPRQ
jgi:crotonobetainyl-CoA:carnitine CoA-transferase CaiB-like acyl-CoA transferase